MMKKENPGKMSVKIETKKRGVVMAYSPAPLLEWLPVAFRLYLRPD